MVTRSIIGTRIGWPLTYESRGFMILIRPSGIVLMSAEVPPMSTVMRFRLPHSSPSERPPMTPPAGPDMRMLTARFEHASTVEIPPFDWMRRRFALNPLLASLLCRLLR